MREWNGFANGERYHEVFTTSAGDFVVEGSLHLRADTVALRDVLIEPLQTKRIPVGVQSVLGMWRTMLNAAKAQGYTYFEIEGLRISGAKPHHHVRLRRKL